MKFENSDLEKWLRKKCMATNTFSRMIGCSRTVIYKIKNDIPVDTKIALAVRKLTKGVVNPKCRPKGRPVGYSQKMKTYVV